MYFHFLGHENKPLLQGLCEQGLLFLFVGEKKWVVQIERCEAIVVAGECGREKEGLVSRGGHRTSNDGHVGRKFCIQNWHEEGWIVGGYCFRGTI